jgi:hypothetical protein
MEAEKSKIKVLADLVPGKGPLPDFKTVAAMVCLLNVPSAP